MLAVIGAWGSKHYGEGGTTRAVDVETGAVIDPVVVDRATGRPLAEIQTQPTAPGLGVSAL